MGKLIRCRDAGQQCDWEGRAETEEELLEKVKEHAKQGHGLEEIPPQLLMLAKSFIKEE